MADKRAKKHGKKPTMCQADRDRVEELVIMKLSYIIKKLKFSKMNLSQLKITGFSNCFLRCN